MISIGITGSLHFLKIWSGRLLETDISIMEDPMC